MRLVEKAVCMGGSEDAQSMYGISRREGHVGPFECIMLNIKDIACQNECAIMEIAMSVCLVVSWLVCVSGLNVSRLALHRFQHCTPDGLHMGQFACLNGSLFA